MAMPSGERRLIPSAARVAPPAISGMRSALGALFLWLRFRRALRAGISRSWELMRWDSPSLLSPYDALCHSRVLCKRKTRELNAEALTAWDRNARIYG